MMQLIATPVIAFALLVNLLLGFLCLFVVAKGDLSSLLLMYFSYALVAFPSLLWGFGRIKAQSKNMHVMGVGLFCTVIVLLGGAIVCGGAFSAVHILEELQAGFWPDANSVLKVIPVTLVFAVVGVLSGFIFAIPFIFLNIIFFFRYRASLIGSGSSSNKCSI